ncbi:MAG TPA: GAF domain-containing protein [Thermodesulfovibrionales bacterium]|nr:GAF domain-containing protein [Thermodesulfovibrionales bacterium]
MFDNKLKLYHRILENIADGVCLVAPDGRIRYWNRGAVAMTGLAPDRVIGKTCHEHSLRVEDEEGNTFCDFLASREGMHECLKRNLFLTVEDGKRKIFVEANISPLYRDNTYEGTILVFRDVVGFKGLRPFQLRTEKLDRLIPICGWCKMIRRDEDTWEQLETYLGDQGFGDFTHSMCPVCAEKIFSKRIYLESYQNVCKAISTSLSVDEVLNLIVTNVVKVMNMKASLVRLLNKEKNQLEIAASCGLSESYVNKGPVEYDRSVDDALAGKPVSIYDITEDKSAKYRKEAEKEGIRTILSIPLRVKDEVIGLLRMYTGEPVAYTDEDLKFLAAIAEQAAIAIMNARHFERIVSKEREYLDIFQAVTKTISSTLNVHEVLDMIVRMIPAVMRLKAATIRLLDDSGKRLVLMASHGLSERYLSRGPVDEEENVREALNEKPVAIYDVMTDGRITYKKETEQEGIKSVLTLPIIAHGKVIGVLRLLTNVHRTFSQDEIDFTVALAEQCGIAIENARMYEKLYLGRKA